MIDVSKSDEKLFGRHTKRIQDACEKGRVDFARVCKSFRYLTTDPTFKGQGEDALIDYMETRVKMLGFGAINNLPGEKE